MNRHASSIRWTKRAILFGFVACCATAWCRAQNAPLPEAAAAGGVTSTSSTEADTPVPDATSASEEKLTPDEEAALAEGRALFRGLCSGCHGGAGRGGKGPNLTDDRWLHGGKDEDLARVIKNGVPRTTMKKLGESLKEEQITKIISYVRSLGRVSSDDTWEPYIAGDPKAGEQLFFDPKGKALCHKCHAVGRRGGRIGPPLDRISVRRSPQYIMESMVTPSKDIAPRYEVVQVVTNEGQLITGLRVNETNFSIQLREENGRFHSLLKQDLEELRLLKTSLMPDNLIEQLTVKQLHDLFAFLMTLE